MNQENKLPTAERYISKYIASLAKEKSFDVKTPRSYEHSGHVIYESWLPVKSNPFLPCCTLSFMQQWLRDHKNCHIWVVYDYPFPDANDEGSFKCCWYYKGLHGVIMNNLDGKPPFVKSFDSYEDALEEGLIYVLNKL